MKPGYRGRFAPSPTGLMHLGSGATALLAAARARAFDGAFVLRIEDLDPPRVVAGSRETILEDLKWLGVTWSEGPDVGGPAAPYDQSLRGHLYETALEELARRDLTYLCDCSRAEIARVASAPHGDEGPRYPGTCRALGMRQRAFRRLPATRLAVPANSEVRFVDAVVGPIVDDVAASAGDFVLRRGDGVFAYQLAVVVDDLAMGITEVVRGADLLGSTSRQILLARLLGGEAPGYAHVPLVVASGSRLAKRAAGMTLRDERSAGRDPRDFAAALALALRTSIDREAAPVDALARAVHFEDLAGRGPLDADDLARRP